MIGKINVLIVLVFDLKLDTLNCFDFLFLLPWSHQKSLIHNVFIINFITVKVFFFLIFYRRSTVEFVYLSGRHN